ncbi:MAG: hypothetical protein NPIRA05_04420 [Nitrospirales bacterium]|nr:MAG: hypothetical protein NPIRA05_04420 [Nitrospirales bacterium]
MRTTTQMILNFRTTLATACLALAVATPVVAQDPQVESLSVEPGSNGSVVTGYVEAYNVIDYIVSAKANQRLLVNLETDNSSNYFNVTASGASESMHIGSVSGNTFEAGLPADGDYTIRVYLMRNAARRNESATYSLSVNIFDGGFTVPAPANDFADGFGGGPDMWEVTGVGGGDSLNLREGPSTQARIIGKLVNGDVLRNRGCKMSEGQRWCKIERMRDPNTSGWVAGRYLREASGPSSDATVLTNSPVGNGQPFNATGKIPCSLSPGQPTGSCAFGVIRESVGNAGVWIDMNGNGERYFLFEDSVPVYTDSASGLTFDRSEDLFLIHVGDEERYEIPEAVVFGG